MTRANQYPQNIYNLPEQASQQTTVMICAFEGWNDAGSAASEALDYLTRLYDARVLECFDTEDFYDFSELRPLLVSQEDGSGELTWPELKLSEITFEQHNLRLLLLTGPEPQFRWKTFLSQLFALAKSYGVAHFLMLGALLAEIPHTRPFPVSISSYTGFLRTVEGIEPQTYTGPTGIIGVLAYEAGQAEFSDVSAWVSVPHYAGHPPHPKATYSLLLALESMLDISIPLQPIEDEVHAWERGASELLEEEPQLADYVAHLEAQADQVPMDFSGDDLAAELERFLKRRNEN